VRFANLSGIPRQFSKASTQYITMEAGIEEIPQMQKKYETN